MTLAHRTTNKKCLSVAHSEFRHSSVPNPRHRRLKHWNKSKSLLTIFAQSHFGKCPVKSREKCTFVERKVAIHWHRLDSTSNYGKWKLLAVWQLTALKATLATSVGGGERLRSNVTCSTQYCRTEMYLFSNNFMNVPTHFHIRPSNCRNSSNKAHSEPFQSTRCVVLKDDYF